MAADVYISSMVASSQMIVRMSLMTCSFSVTFLNVGVLASNISFRGNYFDLTSTNTGASNKWLILLYAPTLDFSNNTLTATFDASATNNFPLQLTSTSGGSFNDNVCTWTTVSSKLTVAGTGWSGARNRLLASDEMVALRGGAATYSSEAAETALKYGATGSRPTLASTDIGFVYYDTTTVGLKTWNGSTWV